MNGTVLQTKIVLPRILLAFAAGLLVSSLFLAIWKIELTAPQYPEGLVLKIFASKLGGDVDVVNGLNHYIGMQTLHTKDFIEFTILPFIIIFLIAWQILTIFINKKSWYLVNAVIFIVIAFICMADFYRWEYNYGHNLDPNAPIQIPGMNYDPPLIGYKQLLNFSAFSIPDTGGWTYIGAGVLIVLSYLLVLKPKWLPFKNIYVLTGFFGLISLTGCSQKPQPINYGKDACDFCKMTIMDKKFASVIVTSKGKNFHFDDMHCMISYLGENKSKVENATVYVNDFTGGQNYLKASESYFVKDPELKTPMNGQIAAFPSELLAKEYISRHGGTLLNYSQIIAH